MPFEVQLPGKLFAGNCNCLPTSSILARQGRTTIAVLDYFFALGTQFTRDLEINERSKYLGVTGVGGRLEGVSKTNGIVSLHCIMIT
jgi:hypothetical protein